MGFVNPYNFVRSGPCLPLQPAAAGDRLQGYSGVLVCRLETVSPIFTPWTDQPANPTDQHLKSFFRIDNTPALPGASLKGMFRSLAETIANGCSPFPPLPKCTSTEQLCIVCRVFGYLGTQGRVHPGRVSISDGLAEGQCQMASPIWLKELSSPKEHHGPFYDAAKRAKGRKFYYHHRHVRSAGDIRPADGPIRSQRTGELRNSRIEPLDKGSFTFQVRYRNLEEVELGLLLHAIQLPSDRYHKFGMGKPLGLGTVQVSITGWQEIDPNPAARYRQFELPATTINLLGKEGPDLAAEAQRLQGRIDHFKSAYAREYARILGQTPTSDLWSLAAPNLEDLNIILSLVPYSTEIKYPTFSWFKSKYPTHPLPTIQAVHSGQRLPD